MNAAGSNNDDAAAFLIHDSAENTPSAALL
jgi:hypothetical protein